MKFAGYDGRDEAESLRGPLYVPSEEARPLEPGEFWEHDLQGLEVVHAGTGEVAGTVAGVVEGPAQDLLVLDTPAGERMVPLVSAIVVNVDVAARRVEIDPPEGLL